MKLLRKTLIASCISLTAALALAQPASAPGAGPGASAPGGPAGMGGMGMGGMRGMGMGPGAGRGAGRWGSNYTPGWALMTPQERSEHRARMQAMKTYDECKAYQTQQHEQMVARAKERGAKPMAEPRRDACAGLKR
ncbi:MAG: hypothetical protein U1E89_05520 [Burkholderiaceae bacterium]